MRHERPIRIPNDPPPKMKSFFCVCPDFLLKHHSIKFLADKSVCMILITSLTKKGSTGHLDTFSALVWFNAFKVARAQATSIVEGKSTPCSAKMFLFKTSSAGSRKAAPKPSQSSQCVPSCLRRCCSGPIINDTG